MKKVLIGLLIIVVVLGIFFALGLTIFNNDAYVLKYANYNEAKAEIERGWIPSDIPDTAVNINEIHILDIDILPARSYRHKRGFLKET